MAMDDGSGDVSLQERPAGECGTTSTATPCLRGARKLDRATSADFPAGKQAR